MIEAIIGFFVGVTFEYILTVPFLVGALILGVLFEHNDARSWSIFFVIISAIVSFFIFDISLVNMALGFVGYLVMGIVWSFWRYKRYIDAKVDKFNKSGETFKDEYARNLFLYDLRPGNMIDTIVAWIIVWPLSAIDNIIGDLINLTQRLVKDVFRKIYEHIFNSSISRLPSDYVVKNEEG